jgi:hypothetical protein
MFENLTIMVTILITLSLSSERLVEIIKGLIPFLNQENPDPTKEGWRRTSIQILAVVAGILTAWLASQIPDSPIKSANVFAYGLLASGGSALWNSVLEYLLGLKDVKETEAKVKRDAALKSGVNIT